MSRCSASQGPTTAPSPCTRLTWPDGNPASSSSSKNRVAVSGVTSEGFTTTVFPEASAGATLCTTMLSGELNAVIPQTTPRGTRIVKAIRCACPGPPATRAPYSPAARPGSDDAARAQAVLFVAGDSKGAVQRRVVLAELPAGPPDLAGGLGQARDDVVHAHAAGAVGHVDGQPARLPVRMRLDIGDRLHGHGGQLVRLDDGDVFPERARVDSAPRFLVQLAPMHDPRAA